MGLIVFTGSGGARAELTNDDRSVEVALIPGGESIVYQLDDSLAEALFQDVSTHFAEHGAIIRSIRYRGELAPLRLAHLAAFAVPIMPVG